MTKGSMHHGQLSVPSNPAVGLLSRMTYDFHTLAALLYGGSPGQTHVARAAVQCHCGRTTPIGNKRFHRGRDADCSANNVEWRLLPIDHVQSRYFTVLVPAIKHPFTSSIKAKVQMGDQSRSIQIIIYTIFIKHNIYCDNRTVHVSYVSTCVLLPITVWNGLVHLTLLVGFLAMPLQFLRQPPLRHRQSRKPGIPDQLSHVTLAGGYCAVTVSQTCQYVPKDVPVSIEEWNSLNLECCAHKSGEMHTSVGIGTHYEEEGRRWMQKTSQEGLPESQQPSQGSQAGHPKRPPKEAPV